MRKGRVIENIVRGVARSWIPRSQTIRKISSFILKMRRILGEVVSKEGIFHP